jgi:membrane-bound lytic murein transglycosylase MltF
MTLPREDSPPGKGVGLEGRLLAEKWHGDLDGIRNRRYLRVLVAPSKLGFHFNGSQMQGAVYDFAREFEVFLNKKLNTGHASIGVVFIPAARQKLIPMLAEGKGDLVASLVGVSERRQAIVEFSKPLYEDAKAIIVSGPGGPKLSQLDDLAGKEVYYYANTLPYERLAQLSESFEKRGLPPIRLTPADGDLRDEDLLEMVNAGLVPMTISEDTVVKSWTRLFTNLQVHSDLVVMEGPLSWAMQKNTPQLKATVDEFVTDHRIGTSYGNTVVRKYLNDIKWVQDATARKDLERFQRLVKFFREYGDKYRFPYLLLAAQGYQESRLDPRLRSRAGAIGVMQIKPSTAAASPIGITDIQKTDRNVEAGAKYLRYMVKQYYENEPMDPVRKGLFALASYNAGPNTIRKLRAEAAAEGYDPNRWFNNVEIIASKRMGNETVQYVSNIYKYYLAYKMVTDRDAKRHRARQNMASRAMP